MLSAYLLRKCRTAAACKYAVWNEGAGNGLWAIQDVFYLNVERYLRAVPLLSFTRSACPNIELCMRKETV